MLNNDKLAAPIKVVVPSRVSLVGNPSDLLGQAEEKALKLDRLITLPASGAVISMPVWSLAAEVALLPSDHCDIIYPKISYRNINEMDKNLRMRGIGNWEIFAHQTVLATGNMIEKLGIEYTKAPFLIQLDTNIPRQRGVSGSSGMILAIMQALLIAHGVEDEFSVLEKAEKVLSVETDLGFNAGLQDRILQSAAIHHPDIGAVFMDFARELRPRCMFETIEVQMPAMALILSSQPSHSSEVHEPIIKRLIEGDDDLVDSFHQLGNFANQAYNAIHCRDWEALGQLMTMTAEKRIEIYGQESLGPVNMNLIDACQEAECPRNFTGSGGAVVALLPEEDDSLARLKESVEKRGEFTVYRL